LLIKSVRYLKIKMVKMVMMDKESKVRLESFIKEVINRGVKEGELFEEFNKLLSKHVERPKGKKYRRNVVCRPVLMISDSSCDEN
jgi:hypothetical protein